MKIKEAFSIFQMGRCFYVLKRSYYISFTPNPNLNQGNCVVISVLLTVAKSPKNADSRQHMLIVVRNVSALSLQYWDSEARIILNKVSWFRRTYR